MAAGSTPPLRTYILFVLAHASVASLCWALQPPKPGELQHYREDGSLATRLEFARELGNAQPDESLIWHAQQKLLRTAGKTDTEIARTIGNAPPPAWQGGLPSTGTPKVFVLLVDFSDYPHSSAHTRQDIESKFFADGNSIEHPYESLRNYYQRSSYNQLTIQGTVFDWYRAQKSRAYYQGLGNGSGQEALMKEALQYCDAQGHDFTQYDNNNDGVIDAFFIKWTGPDNGWSGFWWTYQWSWHVDTAFRVDGKRLGKYVWSWTANPQTYPFSVQADIHETGHLLGLPDLYDYSSTAGPSGGVGGLDMMDSVWGDHNCYSKYLLDWLTPTAVFSGEQTLALNPSGTSPDCVLIMPGLSQLNPFAEFFMVQYRKRSTGNDPSSYPTDGFLIWHVDARLDNSNYDFLYDNSYTDHKYLRLMEADGLEQIEQKKESDAGDFYIAGKQFGSATTPNSRNYAGQATGVTVDQIGPAGSTLSGRFAVIQGPEIIVAGHSIVAESCTSSGTGTIDPRETVTLELALANVGGQSTTHLVATLLPSDSVASPSPAQDYGTLAPDAPAVSRPFTFTANAACGDSLTLSFQFTDSGADLGTLALTYQLGVEVSASENFDNVQVPALPADWRAAATVGNPSPWATVSNNADTSPNCAFAPNPAFVSDNALVSPAFFISAPGAQLSFRHRCGMEAAYDGGVLEISIDGSDFLDILAAGGTFITGGYTTTLPTSYGNPLGGRQAWTGALVMSTTTVSLPAAAAGKMVSFRWRAGTDNAFPSAGWYLDTITLDSGYACCESATGACCLPDLTCTTTPQADCLYRQGSYAGDGQPCELDSCCPYPFADADRDSDVDAADFASFQNCVHILPDVALPAACRCFDRNHDGLVNAPDFEAFARCGTGPEIPWTPTPDCEP